LDLAHIVMRKIVDGSVRNKERTKEKLLAVVGDIIREEGHTGLGVNKVAKIAGVSKKLIYKYFGSMDELLNTYLRKRDFWIGMEGIILHDMEDTVRTEEDYMQHLAEISLVKLFEHLDGFKEAQKILLWQVSEKNPLLQQLNYEREVLGETMFKLSDPLFSNSDVDLRANYGILLAGVYYLTLHENAAVGSFCGIDLKTEAGKKRIAKSLKQLIGLSYQQAVNTAK